MTNNNNIDNALLGNTADIALPRVRWKLFPLPKTLKQRCSVRVSVFVATANLYLQSNLQNKNVPQRALSYKTNQYKISQ